MHPQSLRSVRGRQTTSGGDCLEQRTEHGGHEARQREAGEQCRIHGKRHLDQGRHELLFTDEHGIVDTVIGLFRRVTMFQCLARGRIRIWIHALIHARFRRRCGIGGKATFRCIRVLVPHIEFATGVTYFALHNVEIDADLTYRLT